MLTGQARWTQRPFDSGVKMHSLLVLVDVAKDKSRPHVRLNWMKTTDVAGKETSLPDRQKEYREDKSDVRVEGSLVPRLDWGGLQGRVCGSRFSVFPCVSGGTCPAEQLCSACQEYH